MDDGARKLAHQMLAETRDEVTRADNKASLLLTGVGVIAGVIAAAALGGDWRPSQLASFWEVVWWIGAALGVGCAGCLALAVIPRITHKASGPTVGYFNDVALLKGVDELEKALVLVDPDERVVSQLFAVSGVARRKYIWVQRSIVVGAIGLALLVVSTLVG